MHLRSDALATAASDDQKHSDSLLSSWERSVVDALISHVPAWLQSHHLTMLTLVWSVLAALVFVFAKGDVRWLWAVSALIALQYVTDALDGKTGRLRGAGLVRWGYYMDHLLDYVFLCTLLLGYTMLVPDRFQYLMTLVLALSGGFMVSSFLARSVTGVLLISFIRVGALEIRLVFIGINTLLATVGNAHMLGVLPYVVVGALCVLCVMVYQTQRSLWRLDRVEAGAPTATGRVGESHRPYLRPRASEKTPYAPRPGDIAEGL